MVKTWILKNSTPSRKKKISIFFIAVTYGSLFIFLFLGTSNPAGVPSLVAIIPFLFVPLKKEIQDNETESIVGIIFLKVSSRVGGISAETD